MSLTTEQIEQILEGAPDGATHVDFEDVYWELEDGRTWGLYHRKGRRFISCRGIHPSNGAVYALSDLAEILALRKRVAELESIRTGIGEYLFEMAACFTVEVHNDLTRIMESKEQSE